MTALRPELPALPDRIKRLPVSERGYLDGVPDFRVIGPNKVADAYRNQLCWVCGEKLGSFKAFLIGPMCAINRVSSEPPSHRDCAEFSARACPFLARPHAHRRESNLPTGVCEPAGVGISRNPGVALVWVTKKFRAFRAPNGVLFDVGEPLEVVWYAEGRLATRAEVVESVDSGYPTLYGMAAAEGPEAIAALEKQAARAELLYPAAA